MKSLSRLPLLALLLSFFGATAFAQTDYFVFKTTGAFTVNEVIPDPQAPTDTFIQKLFTGNDIVNAALGRKLGSPVNSKTEVLAVAVTYANDAANSQLIIYDTTTTGVAAVKAVIATISNLDLQTGYDKTGEKATAVATIVLMPNGDPTSDPSAIVSGTLTGAAEGSEGFGSQDTAKNKYVLKVTNGAGTVQGKFTDSKGNVLNVNGIVTKGFFNASGKYIGTYTE